MAPGYHQGRSDCGDMMSNVTPHCAPAGLAAIPCKMMMFNGATLALMAAAVVGTIDAATVSANHNSGFNSAQCRNGYGTPFNANINNSMCLRTASVGQTCQVSCALGYSANPAFSTYSCQRYYQGMY